LKTCIQCNSDITKTFTLYQVNGERYLYCENCKSPYEPYINPSVVDRLNEDVGVLKQSLSRAKKVGLVLLLIGFAFGYVVGG
jgi:hypothetical protein